MEINLDVSRCCIETASKKKHDRLVMQYFNLKTEDQKKMIEHQISALKFLLEHADFSDLRYRCSELDKNEISLVITEQLSDMYLRSSDTQITPKWKKATKDQ